MAQCMLIEPLKLEINYYPKIEAYVFIKSYRST